MKTGHSGPDRPNRSQNRRARMSPTWFRVGVLTVTVLVSALALTTSAAGQSILEPAASGARRVADLWWLMFWLGTIIFILVMLLLLASVTRGSRDLEASTLTDNGRHSMVLGGGVIMPFIVLAIVFGFTLHALTGLAEDQAESEWTIDVVGHQYWWDVRYPDQNVITANEIHIPVGEPVRFQLTSADVIHSFWVPELHGKIDMMPGTTTSITITADEPGRYRGQCAQLCGVQHANMAMYVVAQEPAEFDAWLTNQQQDASVPPEGSVIERGEEIFLSSSCVYCHAVRGSNPAAGEFGPDLTHLASRETLAAGILENNQGNLAAWIVDPQHIKPGNLMPAANYNSEDLLALIAYLSSLD